jgi:hypothetical protein
MKSSLTGQRLMAVFLCGWLLFNYPLLELFNSSTRVLGIPLLYAYIFGAWMLLIGAVAWMIERRGS